MVRLHCHLKGEQPMPIADQIETYSVYVARNDLGHNRVINLKLQSGETARIEFPEVVPADWLQFVGSATNLYMAVDEFDDVYRLLRDESPVFFTALDLFGLRVGAVHTDLDLDAGEIPGQEDEESQTLEAMIRRARMQAGTQNS
jgi:hypothetical protein